MANVGHGGYKDLEDTQGERRRKLLDRSAVQVRSQGCAAKAVTSTQENNRDKAVSRTERGPGMDSRDSG